MKDGLAVDAIARIADVLSKTIDDFPSQAFKKTALSGLDALELKQRVDHLIHVLAQFLPADFHLSAAILLQLKQHWDWGDENDALSSFAAWPLIDYVAHYGRDEPELALQVLKTLTPLFSAEFAIRPFIEQHFDITYQHLLLWCSDDDEHVRRLASEGIRPRLPWGKRLKQFCDDPQVIFPLLEQLKDDTSVYVRKSVANNLNDISKDNPDEVIKLCQRWLKNASAERQFIIRQALRTLIKSGRPDVFPLLGYTAEPKVELIKLSLSKNQIKLGDVVEFSVELKSTSKQEQGMVLDYAVHHVKANGTRTSKVFKWKNITLQPNESIQMTKAHSFKRISTRKYYAGMHRIVLHINGRSLAELDFELIV